MALVEREEPGTGTLESALANLGSICWRNARAIALGWLVAALIGGLLAAGLSGRLLSGDGDIEGSMSLRVDESLHSVFERSDAQSLILLFRSTTLDQRPADLAALVERLDRRLMDNPSVGGLTGDREIRDRRLLPATGTGHFIIIDLKTEDLLATEQEVPNIRAAIGPVLAEVKSRHRDFEWAITGRAALTYDISRFIDEDSARAEIRALPLTLVVLIAAFGSLVAAAVPLLLAVVTRTVALGLVFLIAGPIEVSNLVQGIATMLAIALGIDYSLFLIHRYRMELIRLGAELPRGEATALEEQALRGAMAQSGAAVVYSGATVAIGMGALLATPLMQTRSIGLGGLLVVLVTLLVSLTLVPAILRLLGSRRLEWPALISRRVQSRRSRRLWERWAAVTMRRPVPVIAASLALLLTLAAPALHTRFGFPEDDFLPAELEFSRGLEMLDAMQLKGMVSPIAVVVSDRDGKAALTAERAPALEAFMARLEADRRIRAVLGPVQSASSQEQPAATLEEAMGRALTRNAFVSADRTRLLFQIIPSGQATLADLRQLTQEIPDWLDAGGLGVEVGGQAQYFSDLEAAVGESYPLTIGLVLFMSALTLLMVFRAPLASAKAIFLNLLSVAAGYGVVVWVFQLGHGSELFGIGAPTQLIPITVPLVIFCILFGLSMDYEIFLLSRVRALFAKTGDNERSVGEALAETGAVITNAALIMVIVFGAFAFARVFIVQMIGLGLAVAVLVDATVIRSALGPALMQVAGRWNWWPGLDGQGIRRRKA